MSNKSSESSQTIALPKGGGAIRGIGEKFSPDLLASATLKFQSPCRPGVTVSRPN
jgi:hypothetical protein